MPKLEMRSFQVRVLVVPPLIAGREPYYETRTIVGYTLKDAKRRAGIQ
jgi:hypothetical protein